MMTKPCWCLGANDSEAHPHKKIGCMAVHGTTHLRPLEVDVGLRDLLLGGVERRRA
jgi:hypothetical protein